MISTRLTKFFDIEHPIILAPMTPAAGADLATAVAAAGGLGLLGGGYGDRSWFEAESAKVMRNDVGCGFITWSVAQQPDLLDFAIERHPRAVMLSFADLGLSFRQRRRCGAFPRLISSSLSAGVFSPPFQRPPW